MKNQIKFKKIRIGSAVKNVRKARECEEYYIERMRNYGTDDIRALKSKESREVYLRECESVLGELKKSNRSRRRESVREDN